MKYSLIIEYPTYDQGYVPVIETAIGKSRSPSTTDLGKVSFDFYQLLSLKKAIEKARGLRKCSIRVLEHNDKNVREWSRNDFHEKIHGK